VKASKLESYAFSIFFATSFSIEFKYNSFVQIHIVTSRRTDSLSASANGVDHAGIGGIALKTEADRIQWRGRLNNRMLHHMKQVRQEKSIGLREQNPYMGQTDECLNVLVSLGKTVLLIS
jgi:hypothetical protein